MASGAGSKGKSLLRNPKLGSQGRSDADPSLPLSASLGSDDESTIKVAPTKKDGKEKAIKLKKSAPKQSKPGNWRDGSVIDGTCSAIDSQPHAAGRNR
jgi:hypothetical protein